MDIGDVRPSVRDFAVAMETKLRKSAHKGDQGTWRHEDPAWLLDRLIEEVVELQEEVGKFPGETLSETHAITAAIEDEAVDVANFAMMLFDAMRAEHGAPAKDP